MQLVLFLAVFFGLLGASSGASFPEGVPLPVCYEPYENGMMSDIEYVLCELNARKEYGPEITARDLTALMDAVSGALEFIDNLKNKCRPAEEPVMPVDPCEGQDLNCVALLELRERRAMDGKPYPCIICSSGVCSRGECA